MHRVFLFLLSGFILLLTSCSTHTLMKEQEIMTIEPSYQFSETETEFKDLGEWWKSFKTDELDNLVQKALKNNFEIQESLAVIEQQKAALGVTKAGSLPDISAELERSGSFTSTVSDNTVTTEDNDTYTLGLSATYTLDLYGENSYNLTAAEMTILGALEDHRTLLSETIQNLTDIWLTIQELEARIELLRSQIDNNEANVKFVTRRHKLGLSTLTEALQAQQELISSKSELPPLKSELYTNKHSLKILIGEYPQLNDTNVRVNFSQPLPKIIPGIPSDLIQRRSDIRSALLDVKIADNQVGAAVAATFPKISLTASAGTSSSELKNLTNPDYAFWNLIGNIALPILDAEGRKSEVERQKAVLKENVFKYKNTVFEAFKEVADNLSSIEISMELIDLLRQKVLISKQTLNQTLNSYREGLEDWSEVLDAQSDYYDTEDSLISAQKELISLRISLMVSLGENWTIQQTTVAIK